MVEGRHDIPTGGWQEQSTRKERALAGLLCRLSLLCVESRAALPVLCPTCCRQAASEPCN